MKKKSKGAGNDNNTNTNKLRKIMPSKNFVFVFCIIIILITIAILSVFISNNNTDDTYRIVKKISNELMYKNVTILEEKEDKKDKFSYTNAAYLYIESMGKIDDGEYVVAVYKFKSNLEATKKEEYFNSYNQLIHDKFDKTAVQLSDDYDNLFLKNFTLIKGKYLFSINHKSKYRKELVNYIEKIIGEFNISDEAVTNEDNINKYYENKLNNASKEFDKTFSSVISKIKSEILSYVTELEGCVGSKCDELCEKALKYEKYDELSEEVAQFKNRYNEIISAKEEIVNSINNDLSEVKRTLSQEQFNDIKNRISSLDDTYFDKYKDDWNNQLKTIEESVFKNSCSRYSYKDLLRNPSNYNGKNTYFLGKILQKVSQTQYRVGVDCSKYSYIAGYHCDNTIYVVYYGDTNFIEDDMVELWGTMQGTQTYTTVMGASVTIPKLSAKYAKLK